MKKFASFYTHLIYFFKASVRLEEVPLTSPLAQVKGAIYHFSFHTDRYSQSPLVIQGPLSDSLNTASGIVGDLLRIARSLGASDRGRILKSSSVTVSSSTTFQRNSFHDVKLL